MILIMPFLIFITHYYLSMIQFIVNTIHCIFISYNSD